MTHEMTLAVKDVDNIGHLVDKILAKPGITLEKFEWKALEVLILSILRSQKLTRKPWLKEWSKGKVFASRWVRKWVGSSVSRK